MPMTEFKMTEKINWEESYGEILEAYQHLIDNGWIKPPVRTLIYQLNAEHPDKWHSGNVLVIHSA